MAENSPISWTHHTWSPWWGCHRVSPGCEHCYAETFAKRTGHAVWGRTAPRRFLADPFRALLKMQTKAEKVGERHRVFIASMADIFEAHPEPEVRARQDAIRAELWTLTTALTSLDLLLLTKRPQNVREMVPAEWMGGDWPRNVWMLTTCEDQERFDARIVHLLALPAPVRGISYEPALGPINFAPALQRVSWHEPRDNKDPRAERAPDGSWKVPAVRPALDWVIVGGESGGGARPFDVAWARDTIRQCRESGVACFTKQLGANPWVGPLWLDGGRRLRLGDTKGGDPNEWPADLRVRQYPGGAA